MRPYNNNRDRAFFKRILAMKSTRTVAWYRYGDNNKLTGKRPKPRGELTEETCFGPSGLNQKTQMKDEFKCIEIKLSDPNLKLYLHSKPGIAFFIGLDALAGIVYESISYETTASALEKHRAGRVLWEKVKPIGKRGKIER